MDFYLIRLFIIVLGIITGIVLYYYVVKPHVLEPACMINSNGCVRMRYYSYNNSVLIQMIQNNVWVWYNGDNIYIYGQPIGQICKDPANYTAAYAVDGRTGLKKGYECVMTVEKVLQFYQNKKVKPKGMVYRVNNPETFNVYDLMNLFDSKNIINLQN